jgi:hypothetical protein
MQDHRTGEILPIEIMARKEEWNDGVSVYMRQMTVGVGSTMALPVVFAPQQPNERAVPMLSLTIHQAQQLMDELWDCGMRPSEGSGSAGAMAAVQAHLSDMRKLVFKA